MNKIFDNSCSFIEALTFFDSEYSTVGAINLQ